jgi:tRNA (guanine10-N2)-methyltransferase
MRRYLFTVVLRNPTFVISDLLACARYHNFLMDFSGRDYQIGQSPETAFIVAAVPSDDDAVCVARRSISVKSVSLLLAESQTLPDLFAGFSACEHRLNEGSFKVEVQTHNHSISGPIRQQYISDLADFLPITSPVNLIAPDRRVLLSLQYPLNGPAVPTNLYASVFLSDGNLKFPTRFSLPERSFIKKTSMEPAIALHSAVQALLGPGRIALDPFCGSGSLLVAGASLGASVIGSDFDRPSMVGHDAHSICSNFRQDGLADRLIGLFRCDFLQDNLRTRGPFLDAIVIDPPYGIRERQIADDMSPLLTLLIKLYAFAARALKLGGRLVYWLPCGYNMNADTQLPTHPALRLVAHSQQALGCRYCRELVTIEKAAEIEAEVAFAAPDASWLRVRQLVFTPVERPRGKNKRERRKFTKQLNAKLHGLDQPK